MPASRLRLGNILLGLNSKLGYLILFSSEPSVFVVVPRGEFLSYLRAIDLLSPLHSKKLVICRPCIYEYWVQYQASVVFSFKDLEIDYRTLNAWNPMF